MFFGEVAEIYRADVQLFHEGQYSCRGAGRNQQATA